MVANWAVRLFFLLLRFLLSVFPFLLTLSLLLDPVMLNPDLAQSQHGSRLFDGLGMVCRESMTTRTRKKREQETQGRWERETNTPFLQPLLFSPLLNLATAWSW